MTFFQTFPHTLINKFEELEGQLIDILLQIENFKTAKEEYRRSLRCMKEVIVEKIPLEYMPVHQMAVYLPYNNVLYSYILYGLVPSLYIKQIYIRPSYSSASVAIQIHTLLKKALAIENINLDSWSRQEFLKSILPSSQVVAFTGKYSNLIEITNSLRTEQLLLYGGDGLISFVVAEDADIDAAIRGAISDRLYASGQDCICPDVFIVHEKILHQFVDGLASQLKLLKAGKHSDKFADYSPILKDDVCIKVLKFLQEREKQIYFGGQIDLTKNIIPPTIILEENIQTYDFFEFYSPIFRIYPFKSFNELKSFYALPFQEESKMGVSVFGGKKIVNYLKKKHYIVAHNKTFFDIENGNMPFGGYGIRASHVQYFGKIVAHPILISKEMKRHFRPTLPILLTFFAHIPKWYWLRRF